MATNLALNDELIDETLKLSGAKSKKDAVNMAMAEFIKSRRRHSLMNLKGRVQFDEKYDYKKSRRR